MDNNDSIKKLTAEIEKLKGQLLQVGSLSKAIVKSEMNEKLYIVKDLENKLSHIEEILSDPNDGIIVKVNKNTEIRIHDRNNDKQKEKVIIGFTKTCNEMKDWKSGVTKALWILFAAIIGITIKLVFIPL